MNIKRHLEHLWLKIRRPRSKFIWVGGHMRWIESRKVKAKKRRITENWPAEMSEEMDIYISDECKERLNEMLGKDIEEGKL